ncbi:MAG TPA: hypothetical protein VFC07_05535, partial [Verrucomicrobiae bacterium]|nr:hypothetical protein [Verrucomicrobiae bacterium]
MKYMLSRIWGTALLAGLAMGLLASERSAAAAFVYKFDDVFDGAKPGGGSPYITTSFTDLSSGVVQLKISASGLVGNEYLSGLFLNLDSSEKPGDLNFTYVGGSGGFSQPKISTGENKFKADGVGKFDIDLTFSAKTSKAFSANEYVIYNITSSAFTL